MKLIEYKLLRMEHNRVVVQFDSFSYDFKFSVETVSNNKALMCYFDEEQNIKLAFIVNWLPKLKYLPKTKASKIFFDIKEISKKRIILNELEDKYYAVFTLK